MPRIDTIYFIHHSHTDIGYTHDQPIVWDLQERFIDQAIDCAEAWAGSESDGAFRWTVESTAVLHQWLQHTTSTQIDRFMALERAGRIEVTAMLANLTPLVDTDQLIESLQLLRRLRHDYGCTIRHAMNCDVNGHNWPLVDVLLDVGIEAFSMAVNPHYGGAPLQRPNAFWWQGSSGRKLLTWNGWLYIAGKRFGIGQDDFAQFEAWWPRIERYLAEQHYPLTSLMIQSDHPFGDNGSAFAGFADFIHRWNAAGKTPRLKFATPAIWWAAVRAEADKLLTYRGDWTDYWNFGCISSARETAVNRASRTRLRTADALAAIAVAFSDEQLGRVYGRYRQAAWHHLHFWDEHTWGADQAIHKPYLEDTAAQWHHKAHNAYQARSLSLLLQRDALAALAKQVAAHEPGSFLLFNPLSWPRLVAGDVAAGILSSRNLPWDDTAGRHFQDRMADVDSLTLVAAKQDDQLNINARLRDVVQLKPVELPGFGYKVVSPDDFVNLEETLVVGDSAAVENQRHHLLFDRERGGILHWTDKLLDVEWVDQTADYPLHSFVHESVADRNHPQPRKLHYEEVWEADLVDFPEGWNPDWQAARRTAVKVVSHKVYHTPLGSHVVQHLEAPGCAGLLKQNVFLPNYADFIECRASWQMGLETHPEATYLLFPFNLPQATARFDVGGQAVVAGEDQLPGVCRDYFTVQGWVDFNNGQLGMTVATPENPMVQLGDFHFGQRQQAFKLDRAMLLGWVTNNYWGTNFRAHQPGEVRARYRLRPHAGAFDEAQAHRFGLEAARHQPLLQQFGEPRTEEPHFPAAGSLLHLPDNPSILTLHVKRAHDGAGVVVRLVNVGDEVETAVLRSAQLQIQTAYRCTLLEEPIRELPVHEGAVELTLAPREMTAVHLTINP
ncbi:glycosyl hydrolase-related protein [Candidatus Leptofilum sp.]|uniref:glycoside hydrolase family 38 N-terminal domain-containing protein n=1 Tax=Candidatus Leptofilum sp. TaxID=3241576 RepID=UPI003B5B0FD7